jgi:hypothetical protein
LLADFIQARDLQTNLRIILDTIGITIPDTSLNVNIYFTAVALKPNYFSEII